MNNKVNIDLLEGVSLEELAIEGQCNDAFEDYKNQNFIRDSVFNILQLWLLMSFVSAYVLKDKKIETSTSITFYY